MGSKNLLGDAAGPEITLNLQQLGAQRRLALQLLPPPCPRAPGQAWDPAPRWQDSRLCSWVSPHPRGPPHCPPSPTPAHLWPVYSSHSLLAVTKAIQATLPTPCRAPAAALPAP